jgi:transcription elongation factor S-II
MPLNESDVNAKGRDITKAASSPNSTPTVLALLADLRNGVEASESLLRKTKIGLIIGRLRQHSDKTVQRQAHELIQKWKADVGGKRSSGASTPKPGANGDASPAPAANRASTPSSKGKAKLVVPKEKRNAKEDGVKWQLTGNATRDACLKLMYDGLAFMSEEGKPLLDDSCYGIYFWLLTLPLNSLWGHYSSRTYRRTCSIWEISARDFRSISQQDAFSLSKFKE